MGSGMVRCVGMTIGFDGGGGGHYVNRPDKERLKTRMHNKCYVRRVGAD